MPLREKGSETTLGGVVLEYDPAAGPTNFMVGTEQVRGAGVRPCWNRAGVWCWCVTLMQSPPTSWMEQSRCVVLECDPVGTEQSRCVALEYDPVGTEQT
eukprot:384535-Pelagomonas_calceolata.AAC.1